MSQSVIKSVLHWAIPLAGLLVVGPLLAIPVAGLTSDTGSAHVSLLTSRSPVVAVGVLGLALIAALVLGGCSAKLFGPRPAMTTAGLLLIWPVWVLGESARVLAGGASPVTYAVEGVFAAICVLVLVVVFARLGAGGQGSDALGGGVGQQARRLASPGGLVCVGVGLVVAMGLVWLLGRGDERGQAIFATGAAAFGAGILGRLAGEQVDAEAPMFGVAVGVAIAAVVSPLVGMVLAKGGVDAAAASGTLPGLLRVQAMDWVPGVALGLMPGFAAAAKEAEAKPAATAPQRKPA